MLWLREVGRLSATDVSRLGVPVVGVVVAFVLLAVVVVVVVVGGGGLETLKSSLSVSSISFSSSTSNACSHDPSLSLINRRISATL